MMTREPIAAGKFYTADSAKLQSEIAEYLENAESTVAKNPAAIIVPHAGYPFSGPIAAESFNTIDPDAEYENIFLIGSSHRGHYGKASIYTEGNYETPLGEATVNLELAKKFVNENDIFDYVPQAHSMEHSLEVQLPFIQYHFKKEIPIVPIVLGVSDREQCKEIARILEPYFNEKNLFVISTDFSHFPPYEPAIEVDNNSAEAIVTNNPDSLEKAMKENEQKKISNLSTSMCGWTSVMTLMEITQDKNIDVKKLRYRNSGDTRFMGKDEVVGYWAILFERQNQNRTQQSSEKEEFSLSGKEKKNLAEIARNTLESYLAGKGMPEIPKNLITSNLQTECGAFVTLNKDGQLRGCIGSFEVDKPLYKVVQEMAVAAAVDDARFPTVAEEELKDIDIEISVLTPMKKIHSIDEFELGKHGIYIKKNNRSGTFLPQVADKADWTKEEFLGHCARDKAHIGWDGWKDAELYVYEAIVFSEQDFVNL
ncbi:MAG: AmmeMemoRadiSam system protein B [Bacteroidales bacterium]|nr:AmmeMemoRadiSam system protein B [Bacteroidales bacterium]